MKQFLSISKRSLRGNVNTYKPNHMLSVDVTVDSDVHMAVGATAQHNIGAPGQIYANLSAVPPVAGLGRPYVLLIDAK
jgi:hypothetical protein